MRGQRLPVGLNLMWPVTHLTLCAETTAVFYKNVLKWIQTHFAGLLQVPSDDLSDRRLPLGGGVGVDWNISLHWPGVFLRPAQLQVRRWDVRVRGTVGGTEVLQRCAVLRWRFEAVVLSPAADLTHLFRRQEAAWKLRTDGAVEGLRPRAQEPLHSPALLLAVDELWRGLADRQKDHILIQALLSGVWHDCSFERLSVAGLPLLTVCVWPPGRPGLAHPFKALTPVIRPATFACISMVQHRARETLMWPTVLERLSLSGDKGPFGVPKFSH